MLAGDSDGVAGCSAAGLAGPASGERIVASIPAPRIVTVAAPGRVATRGRENRPGPSRITTAPRRRIGGKLSRSIGAVTPSIYGTGAVNFDGTNDYLTAKILTQNAASLAGNLYVQYVPTA